jgi:oxygen-dependent protoporphyrinogen oxidase
VNAAYLPDGNGWHTQPAVPLAGGTVPHVAIVGGGIAGLAAAFFLRDAPVRVTVFEGSHRIGGKLAVSEIAGIGVDEGAEAMLARRPEGIDLVEAVGLNGELVNPGTTTAAIWTRGAMRPLPGGQVMGVPGDLAALARSGVLSVPGFARAALDLVLPQTRRHADASVASQVGARLGRQVVDRLVEPLLGGVYAGRADELSFEATLPGLAAASRHHRTLTAAARSVVAASRRSTRGTGSPKAGGSASDEGPRGPGGAGGPEGGGGSAGRGDSGGAGHSGGAEGSGGAESKGGLEGRRGSGDGGSNGRPGGQGGAGGRGDSVFTTLAGGLGTLPAAVAAASGARVRTGASVRELRRTPGGWQLTVGSAHDPEYVRADAVVLALPARPAGRLLRADVPAAGALLGEIEYASMAIVTLAIPRGAFHPRPLGSGYLVPAVDGRAVKAVTFSTVKWPYLLTRGNEAGRAVEIVRCSLGRIGEEQVLQRTDEELVALARRELGAATGADGPALASRVTRWGGALPQYTVGHVDRVRRIRAAIAGQPGLAVCGAAYDGLGIPACIATARQASAQVLAHLAQRGPGRGDGGE